MQDATGDFIHRFEPGDEDLTLLLLHGTGGDESDLVPLARRVAPRANLLSPRGRVSEQGMARFFRRLALGVFDIEDLKFRTHELAGFVESAASRYGFDLRRLVVVGYSNGANIGASLLLLRPGLLAGAALLHAMVPFEPESKPNLGGTKILLTGGRRDPMIPHEQLIALRDLLGDAGAEVEVALHAGGHELTMDEVENVTRWLGNFEDKP